MKPIDVRRILGTAISVTVSVAAYTVAAHAHGGMASPEELGPPVATSTILGIASYWMVILWPSRKPKEEDRDYPPRFQRRGPVRRRKVNADRDYQRVRIVKKVGTGDNSGTVQN